MKIVRFATRRPVSVFIFALAATVFGVVSFQRLALDLLPDITYPSLTVRTELEGAAPVEVESLITRPIENAVGVVNNVVRVASSSRTDVSEVTLEFSWGTDMDLAALDVRERLDVLQLPQDAERPILLRYDPALDPILRLGLTGDDDLIRLRLTAEERVKRALDRIEGVAAAIVSGGLEEEIQVRIDERLLAAKGVPISRVANRLAEENINLTGGRLREGQTEFLVRTVNEYLRPSDLERVVLSSEGGAVLRLEDVAKVVRSHKEREIVTRIDGLESVEIAIYKEGGTNTVAVSDAVRERIAEIEEDLREGNSRLRLTVVTDQARYIRQSISEVLKTALFGGTLAIAVLFVFLRSWKTTAIVGLAIPISVVATFFLMYAFGISLNIMSLGGLTLGVGLLVDNSIVVLESIQRRLDQGIDPVEAADRGTNEVGRAVVASTMTTICVFVPIVFVEGIAGQLFGDQALTVTFSLIVSLLVALTVIPMLASRRWTPGEDPATDATETTEPTAGAAAVHGPLSKLGVRAVVAVLQPIKWMVSSVARLIHALLAPALAFCGRAIDRVGDLYAFLLGKALARPLSTIAMAVLILAASLTLAPRLGRELIPELIQGEFFVDIEMPPGTRLEVTERRIARIERTASSLPQIATVYAIVGASNEQGGSGGEIRENIGQVTIVLTPPTSRELEESLMADLREALDQQEDLDYRFGRPSYFSFRTPIEVEIRGYNLALLRRLADSLSESMRGIPGIEDVKSSTEGGSPELQIHFDRTLLAKFGLNIADVAPVIRTKVQGTVATDIQRQDRAIDIRLQAAEEFRDSVSDLERMIVAQVGGTNLPLSAVATIEEVEGPAEIRRAEGERVAVITANLAGRDLASVSEDIGVALRALELPSGFDSRIGGQRQEMEVSFDSMRLAILLAIFMVYLVMASQFESLLHPFVILLSVPFALVGVLMALWIFNVNLSIVVLIGAILLAGVVVNNAILLVDYTNRLRREGSSKIEALTAAGRIRLRPILMTTSTTVLGLLPMAIGLGEGSELRSPMALTVIGGLLSSTALTLLLVPAVYSVLDRKP
ncbi:MAG: efflux RND transporter permease subunit [Acidobacteria bacterium]|nr:efflux RND transporter permease subunit [Acidobacteriota bacterium]